MQKEDEWLEKILKLMKK